MEQSPRSLEVQEGDVTLMSCTHQVSGLGNLQWYKQVLGEGPKLLFSMYSIGDAKQEGRLRATLLKNGSSLSITALQHEDSATYLCAATTVLPRHLRPAIKPAMGQGQPDRSTGNMAFSLQRWEELRLRGGQRDEVLKATAHLRPFIKLSFKSS